MKTLKIYCPKCGHDTVQYHVKMTGGLYEDYDTDGYDCYCTACVFNFGGVEISDLVDEILKEGE